MSVLYIKMPESEIGQVEFEHVWFYDTWACRLPTDWVEIVIHHETAMIHPGLQEAFVKLMFDQILLIEIVDDDVIRYISGVSASWLTLASTENVNAIVKVESEMPQALQLLKQFFLLSISILKVFSRKVFGKCSNRRLITSPRYVSALIK